MQNRAAVEYFHCYLLIVEVRTKGARCLDLTVDGESFAASSSIVIEDLTVQRDREFVDSERREREPMLVKRWWESAVREKHQAMASSVDVETIVSLRR